VGRGGGQRGSLQKGDRGFTGYRWIVERGKVVTTQRGVGPRKVKKNASLRRYAKERRRPDPNSNLEEKGERRKNGLRRKSWKHHFNLTEKNEMDGEAGKGGKGGKKKNWEEKVRRLLKHLKGGEIEKRKRKKD